MTAGLLQHLKRLGRNCFVADSVKVEKKALVDAAEHGDEIAGVINRLRKRIRDGVQSGKVLFLPESNDKENRKVFRPIDALLNLVETSGIADVICIDDRVHLVNTPLDQHGRSVVGSIEVLEYLSAQGSITEEKETYMRLSDCARAESRFCP